MKHAGRTRQDHDHREGKRIACAPASYGPTERSQSLIGRGKHPNYLHSKGRGQRARQWKPLKERKKPKYRYQNGQDKEPIPLQKDHSIGTIANLRPKYRTNNAQSTVPRLNSNGLVPFTSSVMMTRNHTKLRSSMGRSSFRGSVLTKLGLATTCVGRQS